MYKQSHISSHTLSYRILPPFKLTCPFSIILASSLLPNLTDPQLKLFMSFNLVLSHVICDVHPLSRIQDDFFLCTFKVAYTNNDFLFTLQIAFSAIVMGLSRFCLSTTRFFCEGNIVMQFLAMCPKI